MKWALTRSSFFFLIFLFGFGSLFVLIERTPNNSNNNNPIEEQQQIPSVLLDPSETRGKLREKEGSPIGTTTIRLLSPQNNSQSNPLYRIRKQDTPRPTSPPKDSLPSPEKEFKQSFPMVIQILPPEIKTQYTPPASALFAWIEPKFDYSPLQLYHPQIIYEHNLDNPESKNHMLVHYRNSSRKIKQPERLEVINRLLNVWTKFMEQNNITYW